MNKNKKEEVPLSYSLRINLGGNKFMTKFFKELEKGFGEALLRNTLFFTLGWTIGTIIKMIVESVMGSKNK